MRLLNVDSLELKYFVGEPGHGVPGYAILSHVWGDDEISFQEMTENVHPSTPVSRKGLQKILGFCNKAKSDGHSWVWIDTCCIDKSSSAELFEAINSTFNWYRNAAACYAYLFDVTSDEDPAGPQSAFRSSKWFTRGWTLQELLAPFEVAFLAMDWRELGAKSDLAPIIAEITRIDQQVLSTCVWDDVSIAAIMAWAANRRTTRVEDEAYCLMGLFDVNMPLIYGEGRNAFYRLQLEIIKSSDDQSIFAFDFVRLVAATMQLCREVKVESEKQLIPVSFVVPTAAQSDPDSAVISMADVVKSWPRQIPWGDVHIAIPRCTDEEGHVVILMEKKSDGKYERIGSPHFPWLRALVTENKKVESDHAYPCSSKTTCINGIKKAIGVVTPLVLFFRHAGSAEHSSFAIRFDRVGPYGSYLYKISFRVGVTVWEDDGSDKQNSQNDKNGETAQSPMFPPDSPQVSFPISSDCVLRLRYRRTAPMFEDFVNVSIETPLPWQPVLEDSLAAWLVGAKEINEQVAATSGIVTRLGRCQIGLDGGHAVCRLCGFGYIACIANTARVLVILMTNRRDAVYHFRATHYHFAFPAVAAIWRTCKDGLSRKAAREPKAEILVLRQARAKCHGLLLSTVLEQDARCIPG
ncbi:Heterokaryon incompatibility, partial [Metarhizium majus ARSEF 297]